MKKSQKNQVCQQIALKCLKSSIDEVAVFLFLLLAVEKNVASTNYQRWNNSILPLGSTVTYFKPIFLRCTNSFLIGPKFLQTVQKAPKKRQTFFFTKRCFLKMFSLLL